MSVIFTTAEDAENAFYGAIGRGDLEALMSVWADDEEIVCIHPTGQRLTGPAAIRDSWRAIFANNPRLTVHVKRSTRWKSVMLDVHSVVEILYLGDEPKPQGPMLSTNVFQRGPNGWRLLSHHSTTAADDAAAEPGSEPDHSRLRTLH
ncbi:nuclear transport factor 2 family protein [Propionivibrio sp.]|uniref:YybH family protein n=1 Tax=Propionivibrio sp. TaxID=2212460 RepID=UPI00263566E4|nr:nuclear transport factor 2 family protein [Propionivibrio sp.]